MKIYDKLLSMNFISDREILVLTEKKTLLYYTVTSGHKLQENEKKDSEIDVKGSESIMNAHFLGVIN